MTFLSGSDMDLFHVPLVPTTTLYLLEAQAVKCRDGDL